MKEIADQFIQKYFEDLIKHHQSIFGLNENANLTTVNFIAVHEEIFAFVNLIRQIDESFEDDFLDVCLDDIINLVHLINALSKEDDESLNSIYEQFIKLHDVLEDKHQLCSLLKKEFKLHKNILLKLLNTKFYYLDIYIWHKISQSKSLRQLLKITNLEDINDTLSYLKSTHLKHSYMKLDYSSFKIKLHQDYDQKDIDELKLLATKGTVFDDKAPLRNSYDTKIIFPILKTYKIKKSEKLFEMLNFYNTKSMKYSSKSLIQVMKYFL